VNRKVLALSSGTIGTAIVAALSFVGGPAAAQTTTTAANCVDGTGPTSAFYCAPRAQGNPVRACTTAGLTGTRLAACQKTTADSFCRTVSFTSAAVLNVDGRGNLAEVTCSGRQAQMANAVTTQGPATPSTATPTAAPATTPAPAPTQDTSDYVYATGHTTRSGTVTFKPTLQVTAFGPEMSGFTTITNPEADFEAFYRVGAGAYTATRYSGTFSGNVFRGTWHENENEQGLSRVQRTCDRDDGGTRVWGQFEIRFTPDRRSFVGTKTTCDTLISDASSSARNSWKGTLSGRASPSAAAPTGPTPTFANGSSSPASRSTSAQRNTQPSQPRQETVADRVAREAAAAAEQRAKDEARQGVNRAIDNLIRRPR
jgi:hypothetical protein